MIMSNQKRWDRIVRGQKCLYQSWLVVLRHVNTESSICANCEEGKLTQSAKDGERYTMHTLHDDNVAQFTVKHSSYIKATKGYLIE